MSKNKHQQSRHCAWCGDPPDRHGSHNICQDCKKKQLALAACCTDWHHYSDLKRLKRELVKIDQITQTAMTKALVRIGL